MHHQFNTGHLHPPAARSLVSVRVGGAAAPTMPRHGPSRDLLKQSPDLFSGATSIKRDKQGSSHQPKHQLLQPQQHQGPSCKHRNISQSTNHKDAAYYHPRQSQHTTFDETSNPHQTSLHSLGGALRAGGGSVARPGPGGTVGVAGTGVVGNGCLAMPATPRKTGPMTDIPRRHSQQQPNFNNNYRQPNGPMGGSNNLPHSAVPIRTDNGPAFSTVFQPLQRLEYNNNQSRHFVTPSPAPQVTVVSMAPLVLDCQAKVEDDECAAKCDDFWDNTNSLVELSNRNSTSNSSANSSNQNRDIMHEENDESRASTTPSTENQQTTLYRHDPYNWNCGLPDLQLPLGEDLEEDVASHPAQEDLLPHTSISVSNSLVISEITTDEDNADDAGSEDADPLEVEDTTPAPLSLQPTYVPVTLFIPRVEQFTEPKDDCRGPTAPTSKTTILKHMIKQALDLTMTSAPFQALGYEKLSLRLRGIRVSKEGGGTSGFNVQVTLKLKSSPSAQLSTELRDLFHTAILQATDEDVKVTLHFQRK